ncbi:MAG TPA: thioredoxin family protein [Stenomitos sp.]
MDRTLWYRRKLLRHLGLGTAGIVTTVGLASYKRTFTDLMHSTMAIAAPSSGATLPEFQGINRWLNTAPLNVAQLKGKVVLVQFWTFACINCQRTLPYLVQWHQRYGSQGLQIIGVHTPEFAFERETGNVKQALTQHHIAYPVAIDNDYKTWNAYRNGYWPHLFLADRHGILRYDHVGEGAYDTTERTIRQLLG